MDRGASELATWGPSSLSAAHLVNLLLNPIICRASVVQQLDELLQRTSLGLPIRHFRFWSAAVF